MPEYSHDLERQIEAAHRGRLFPDMFVTRMLCSLALRDRAGVRAVRSGPRCQRPSPSPRECLKSGEGMAGMARTTMYHAYISQCSYHPSHAWTFHTTL